MELIHNEAAPMTRWLVASGALSSPFILLDVGVQGGISSHWSPLLDVMKVYGFDLLEEAIAPLRQTARPSDKYFATALGGTDGECEILLSTNKFEARIWEGAEGPRRVVPVRQLDNLFAEGQIELADFIKLDCEGFERYVLDGASRYLAACNMVGAEFESSFNVSRHYHRSQFVETFLPFVKNRLIVYGVSFDRADKPSYVERVKTRRNGMAVPGACSRPNTLNVLVSRDLVAERDRPSNYAFRAPESRPSLDTLIKTMMVLELYGLVDRAYDILENFQSELGQRVDVEKAKNLLIPPADHQAQRQETLPDEPVQMDAIASLMDIQNQIGEPGGRPEVAVTKPPNQIAPLLALASSAKSTEHTVDRRTLIFGVGGVVVIVLLSLLLATNLVDHLTAANNFINPATPMVAPAPSTPAPSAAAPAADGAKAPSVPPNGMQMTSGSIPVTPLAEAPKITTPGLSLVTIVGLNVNPVNESPVVAGQKILRVTTTSASLDGRHYLSIQAGGLDPNRTYRITAWVRAQPGVNVALQGRDQPDSDHPPHNGIGLFAPTNNKVLAIEMNVDGSGVGDGTDGWKRVWIDLPTSDGQFVLVVFLLDGTSYTFKGDDAHQLIFGGIEVAPKS